jgi:uncharacterized protein (TIGR02246 family)
MLGMLFERIEGIAMKRSGWLCRHFLLAALMSLLLMAPLKAAYAQSADSAIKQVMTDQVSAWNRGDIDGFMSGYKNSPETTFIGKTVQHGWQKVLERYKHNFPTKDAMGTLDFSELEVRVLDAQHAVTTGQYHLARSAAGGGDASGVFSLVWEKSTDGWKIILDHTS